MSTVTYKIVCKVTVFAWVAVVWFVHVRVDVVTSYRQLVGKCQSRWRHVVGTIKLLARGVRSSSSSNIFGSASGDVLIILLGLFR